MLQPGLNGSMDNQEAPLFQSAPADPKQGQPQSGFEGCEREDRCCLCLPIKCALLVNVILQWPGFFIYVVFY